jgi:dTDP-4-dehydrorhamnose reductase
MIRKTILVFGANGQLGCDICDVFKEHLVISVTRNEVNALNPTMGTLFEQDIDYVINTVALTNVDGCESHIEHAYSVNSQFVYLLATICNQHDIPIIHISTDYVFGGIHQIHHELSLPSPLNIYGNSKLSGEYMLSAYHDKYFILRVAGLFGMRGAASKGGNFVGTMQRLAIQQDQIRVIADNAIMPTYTRDVAKCILYFVNNDICDYGLYHCVSNNYCSWFEFADAILRESRLDANKLCKISYKDFTTVAKRPQYSILSIKKLSRYYQMPSWQDGLNAYLQAQRC